MQIPHQQLKSKNGFHLRQDFHQRFSRHPIHIRIDVSNRILETWKYLKFLASFSRYITVAGTSDQSKYPSGYRQRFRMYPVRLHDNVVIWRNRWSSLQSSLFASTLCCRQDFCGRLLSAVEHYEITVIILSAREFAVQTFYWTVYKQRLRQK